VGQPGNVKRYFWFSLTVLVASICFGLSLWQFRRLVARRARNTEALGARLAPVVDLGRAHPPISELNNRRIAVRGEFDYAREIILRAHEWRGAPGVQIVTPLRLPGTDTALLVLRGFLAAPDAITPTELGPEPPGRVAVRGIGMTLPRSPDGGGILSHKGRTTWRRLDAAGLSRSLPYPIYDVYLFLPPDSGHHGFPIRQEPPALDDGPHLNYALQWLGIGAAVLGFGLLVVLGVGRGSRSAE
jgi:surfeit locus 1 family protein